MRKAEKLFQITNLIRAKQPITAEQLAEELDVSVRTVYRYIDDLSVSGIPIYGTTGIGYKLHDHYELPPLNLTENELDALILGVKMVTSWTGETLSESARSLVSKIDAVLPSQLRKEYSRTLYAPDYSGRDEDRNVWEIIYKAIKELNSVSIDYNALNGRKTSRTIYPLGLFYWGGKWTIGSWCTLRREFRDFRLDRIERIGLRQKYTKTKAINLESYLTSVEKQ